MLTLYGRHILTDTAEVVQDEAADVFLPSLALWAVHIDKVSDITELLFAALQNSVCLFCIFYPILCLYCGTSTSL